MFEDFHGGPQLGINDDRETPISRTAISLIVVVFPRVAGKLWWMLVASLHVDRRQTASSTNCLDFYFRKLCSEWMWVEELWIPWSNNQSEARSWIVNDQLTNHKPAFDWSPAHIWHNPPRPVSRSYGISIISFALYLLRIYIFGFRFKSHKFNYFLH